MTITIAVLPLSGQDEPLAARLARELSLPLLQPGVNPTEYTAVDAVILVDADGLSLCQTGARSPGAISVEFGNAAMRHRRRAGNNELLGRAVGVGRKSRLCVADGTAGLGRDAFVLADLGCQVRCCERDPIVQQLLQSGLERAARSDDAWLRSVAARMALLPGDIRALPAAVAGADVIYLDPMFPPRDKSAAVKKEMALLQRLLDCDDADADTAGLLAWACRQDVVRVVVKRPPRAPALPGRAPSHCIAGKAVRYDVYALRPWHKSVAGQTREE